MTNSLRKWTMKYCYGCGSTYFPDGAKLLEFLSLIATV